MSIIITKMWYVASFFNSLKLLFSVALVDGMIIILYDYCIQIISNTAGCLGLLTQIFDNSL